MLFVFSLFQVPQKPKTYKNSKWNFSSSCFYADDSLMYVWLHTVVFTEHDILDFWDSSFIKILSSKKTSKLL